jgi:hypothetical protein
MSSLSSVLCRAGGALTRYLGRLCGGLDGLRAQLRAAIASTVSKTVAEAVRDAVLFGLTATDGQTSMSPSNPTTSSSRSSPSLFSDPGQSSWSGASLERDYPDHFDDDRWRHEEPYDSRDQEEERETPPGEPWRQSVALGLQAASWWLGRHPGRLSLVIALGVGVATGVVSLLSGTLGSGLLGVVDGALRLLTVADAVCSGAHALAHPSSS